MQLFWNFDWKLILRTRSTSHEELISLFDWTSSFSVHFARCSARLAAFRASAATCWSITQNVLASNRKRNHEFIRKSAVAQSSPNNGQRCFKIVPVRAISSAVLHSTIFLWSVSCLRPMFQQRECFEEKNGAMFAKRAVERWGASCCRSVVRELLNRRRCCEHLLNLINVCGQTFLPPNYRTHQSRARN